MHLRVARRRASTPALARRGRQEGVNGLAGGSRLAHSASSLMLPRASVMGASGVMMTRVQLP